MRKVIPVLLLTLISTGIVFYQFSQIPKNLAFDEVEFTKLALSLDGKNYIPYSTYATGHSTLYFYILLFSFKIFGVSNFALRLPAAVFGVLNILIFYYILQIVFKQWNNILPFILSIVFLTSHWYFNFTRFAFEATFLLFLELSAIYFFFRYLKSKQSKDAILTAIFSGLAYNSYTPGRIFFLLIFGFLFVYLSPRGWPTRPAKPWRSGDGLPRGGTNNLAIKQLALSIIIFILTMLPLTLYLINNPDIRFDQQFYLKNTEMKISEKISFLAENFQKIAFMFSIKGDINGRHNYPGKAALNPFLGLFFIAGLIIALKNYRQFPNSFFLLYFFLALLPALLTYPWENPNMLRTYTAIPAVIFFIGRSLEFIQRKSHTELVSASDFIKYRSRIPTSPRLRWASRFGMISILMIIIILSSIYELRTYFKYQSEVFKTSFEVKKTVEEIDFTKPIIFKQLAQ